jgi:drug/metabolite transporter (DMT)-like permease
VLAALLALAASLSWGSSNFLAGIESRRRSVWHVTALSQIAAALVAGVAVLVTGQAPPRFWDTIVLLLAGVATAIGIVAFYRALAIGTMSVVAPIVAAQVAVPVAAGLLRGERPGAQAYVGMALTVGGVVLISWARRGDRDHAARSAVLLAVLTALCWGILLTAFGVSGKESPFWAVFDARIASIGVILLYMAATKRRLPLRGQDLPTLFLVGLLLTVANILFTVAAGRGYLSVVSILGSLSPVVVTGYAQVLLGERLTVRQWAGFGTVFAGVVLLSV